jgi:mannose-1-phosphate guanylyltransferase
MMEHYYAVIMAGGGGTRLWPLSRKARPKQLLRLVEDRSLFQMAVDRLQGLFDPNHILVVTVKEQAGELRRQCPQIPGENYLIEPLPRGTASVVGLAAVVLQRRDPQAVMAILTSDHFIGNVTGFQQHLRAAYEVAQEDYLVTLGIAPTFPATGYGYIQRGERIGVYQDLEAYRALRFMEKPEHSQAVAMLAGGDHTWNSGMFIWRVDRILEEIARQMPALDQSLRLIREDWDTRKGAKTLARLWPKIKPETIDYGVMEGARQVAVIPAQNLEWSDVGSWDSLFEVLPTDDGGNLVMGGQHIGLDTRCSLIYVGQEHRLIVTIGVEDLVVVDTGDVLLVCKKDQAQRVRLVVEELKKTGQEYT